MTATFTQKQLEIMESAVKLFAGKGFDNTSVRDIAKAADVNVAMISYYFGSKEKLLEAIFIKYVTTMRGKLEEIVFAHDVTPAEKIDRIIETYIDTIAANRHFHLLMVREQGVMKNKVMYDGVKSLKLKNTSLIKSAIKAGAKAGIFKKNVDITILALTVFGTINQAFNTQRFLCEQYRIDPDNEAEFLKVIIPRLKVHLKAVVRSYLLVADK
ncbi:TetR family transcriptional regulator [Niabella pedocola]|uniref:TetR family transcriptional regulator n=1 Tax=Niabella pedocola TaxID=1752077 RepID=A0ABS8Q007_9BACT|nr:TetR family transcriptional regulator [Niabella pedocola]MCD2425867.1 TetR family transcriptional regulator [Niabella pedocola]